MSWISELTGVHLGNIGAPVGAAIGSVIPGVGTTIGAGLGQALGALGSGKSVGEAAKQGVAAGGIGAALGAIPGVGDVVKNLGGDVEGAVAKIPGGSAILNAVKSGAAPITALGDFVKNNADTLLQGAAVVNAAANQGKANQYAGDALKMAQSAYDAKAPLRDAGIAGLQFASTHGNPFAAGFTGGSALPLAGAGNGTASPSPVAMPTAEALRMAPSGSSMPSDAPSVGAASVPPSMSRPGAAGPLKIATQNLNRGKPSPGLSRSNDLELQKLYQE